MCAAARTECRYSLADQHARDAVPGIRCAHHETERFGGEQSRSTPQSDAMQTPARHEVETAQSGEHHIGDDHPPDRRSEEHTSELQSLMRISYAVFCLKKKTKKNI